MKDEELNGLLSQLIAAWESEVVEFKNVGDSYPTSDIGKYFSALSNEANLRNQERGWLVFGVDNRSRTVAGSTYRAEPDRLNGLKHQIASDTEPGVTFRDIHVLNTPQGRVILFEIPAAPLGIPIAWKGHYYARAGESLTSLGLDKQDEIRSRTRDADWSARRIAEARLDHLDPEALSHARSRFALKHANRFSAKTIAGWSDTVFLDRARLTIERQVTATTLLLLGKPEAAHLLSPHPVQITWRLDWPRILPGDKGELSAGKLGLRIEDRGKQSLVCFPSPQFCARPPTRTHKPRIGPRPHGLDAATRSRYPCRSYSIVRESTGSRCRHRRVRHFDAARSRLLTILETKGLRPTRASECHRVKPPSGSTAPRFHAPDADSPPLENEARSRSPG